VITKHRDQWIETMMTEEHGMPPVTRSPARSALFTFLAFVLCGSVPLLAYLFQLPHPLPVATVMTGATFFAIGSLRSRWSPTPWWRAGLETFVIGMVAALVAYLVGDFLQSIV
jgi:VIT1/CCC1 family predicted Fe2+/Mn2+ transporter